MLPLLSEKARKRADVAYVFIVAWVGKLIIDYSRLTVDSSLMEGRYETA